MDDIVLKPTAQIRLYRDIIKYYRKHGTAPTMAELADESRNASRVNTIIIKLRAKRLLENVPQIVPVGMRRHLRKAAAQFEPKES